MEAALESSEEEENGRVSPPPKRPRREGSRLSPKSVSLPPKQMNQKGKMQTKIAHNGDSESSENGDVLCEVSQNGIQMGGVDKVAALKERNREKIAMKKFSKFDEEVVRLIGQHLDKLGLK